MKTLTDDFVDSVEPAGEWLWYGDEHVRGLGLRVHPSGAKSFVVRYRVKDGTGRQRCIAIGRYPTVGVRRARALAMEINAAVDNGEDPALDLTSDSLRLYRADIDGRCRIGVTAEQDGGRITEVLAKQIGAWPDVQVIHEADAVTARRLLTRIEDQLGGPIVGSWYRSDDVDAALRVVQ